MTTPPGLVSDFRLVMYETDDVAVASLYAGDATPYSEPLFSFPLRPDQELPVLQPGTLVQAHGAVCAGCRPTIVAGGVEIEPAEPLVVGTPANVSSRLFAERGSVICHPAVSGWKPNWRYSPLASVSPLAEWERRLRRAVTSAWILFVIDALLTVLVVAAVVSAGDPQPLVSLLALLATFTTAAVSLRLARRSQRALAEARTLKTSTARPMRMRLWWSAGYGQGPMAVASLFSASGDDALVSHVSVVNVPAEFSPQGLVPVEVLGDPRRAPIVRCGEIELWPTEFGHDLLHVRDGSRGRTYKDPWIRSILGLHPRKQPQPNVTRVVEHTDPPAPWEAHVPLPGTERIRRRILKRGKGRRKEKGR